MTSFWEILKSSKNLKASDAFAELWGKSIADIWDIITITGNLPLTFEVKGEALTNYRLYGTSEGAGVQTDNLWDGEQVNLPNVGARYGISTADGGTYTVVNNSNAAVMKNFDAFARDYICQPGETGTVTMPTGQYSFIFAQGAAEPQGNIMVVKGSTAPASFIPYGYQIPLTVTSGEQSDTYPIYIGDTKLYEDEYVDYQEQKIYRTILLTTHDNKDFITSDNKRFCVRRSNNA